MASLFSQSCAPDTRPRNDRCGQRRARARFAPGCEPVHKHHQKPERLLCVVAPWSLLRNSGPRQGDDQLSLAATPGRLPQLGGRFGSAPRPGAIPHTSEVGLDCEERSSPPISSIRQPPSACGSAKLLKPGYGRSVIRLHADTTCRVMSGKTSRLASSSFDKTKQSRAFIGAGPKGRPPPPSVAASQLRFRTRLG